MGRYILNVPPELMTEAVRMIEYVLRQNGNLPKGVISAGRSYWLRPIKGGVSITLCEPEAPTND